MDKLENSLPLRGMAAPTEGENPQKRPVGQCTLALGPQTKKTFWSSISDRVPFPRRCRLCSTFRQLWGLVVSAHHCHPWPPECWSQSLGRWPEALRRGGPLGDPPVTGPSHSSRRDDVVEAGSLPPVQIRSGQGEVISGRRSGGASPGGRRGGRKASRVTPPRLLLLPMKQDDFWA